MSDEQFRLVRRLFEQAAELPARQRADFLAKECAGDPRLLAKVQALLDADRIENPAVDLTFSQLTNLLSRQADPDPLPFATCGDYRLVSRLGGGGMGEVFLAERIDNGNRVAIKVLKRESGFAPDIVRRFEREKELLGRLQHANIARFYHSGIEAERPWFAMDYVEGRPIDAYCKANHLPLRARLELMGKLCAAVAHAHVKLIVHCDLTPNNILVTEDGEPHLVDFGIARMLSEAPGAPRLTSGSRPYSVDYASPEQIRNKPLDTRTDSWSLGAILYTLLAGTPPFVAEGILSDRAIEDKILNDEPLAPSAAARGHGVPSSFASLSDWKELDTLCLWALRKEPENRCGVDQLGEDIGHFLRTEPLMARPAGWRYVAAKFLRRNKAWVVAATVVFAVIAGIGAFSNRRIAQERDKAVAEALRTRRIQRFMLNLFQGDDKESGPAGDLRVVTLIDRGVPEARSLSSEPRVQAELYRTLGTMYRKLGKLDRADGLLQSSLKLQESLPERDYPAVADNFLALGLLRSDQGQSKEALRMVHEALTIVNAHESRNKSLVAAANFTLGEVLVESGKQKEGADILTKVVSFQSAEDPKSPELAKTLRILTDAHIYLGNYSVADSLGRRALAIDRQIYGSDHPEVSDDLGQLAQIQEIWGNYAEAEGYERQSLGISEAWYGKDHPDTAEKMTILASTLYYEGKGQEVDELLKQALVVRQRVYGKGHPKVAYVLNSLGSVAVWRKDFKAAEAYDRRVAEIYRAAYGDGDYRVAVAIGNLGAVYFAEKRYVLAEQLFRDAVRRQTKALSADNINTGEDEVRLGRTLLRERRYREAEEHSRTGYEVLVKQTSPSTSFVEGARNDLATIYEALRRPDDARKFRAEPGKINTPGADTTSRK